MKRSIAEPVLGSPRLGGLCIVLLLLCVGAASDAQPPAGPAFSLSGSLVVAAITPHGIVVASDSRGTIRDAWSGRPIAFYDAVQKVFPIQNAVIAYTGSDTLGNRFLGPVIEAFRDSPHSRQPVPELLQALILFVDQNYPPMVAQSMRAETLIAAGYDQGKPYLCYRMGEFDGKFYCQSSGFIPALAPLQAQDLENASPEAAADLVRSTIATFPRSWLSFRHQPGVASKIGGPTRVRLLFPDGSRWYGAPPASHEWLFLSDWVAAYRAGKVHFTLYPGVTQKDVASLLERGATWSRNAGEF